MKYVAILNFSDRYAGYDDYGGSSHRIIESISDWSEVSDEDYRLLISAVAADYNLRLIERKDKEPKFIPRLISEYIEAEKIRQKKEAEEKQKKEELARQRALKKKAKTEAEEKKLLADLLKKHGEQNV